MRNITTLTTAAQEILEDLYENGTEARAMADALADVDVLKEHDWSEDAIEEAYDWCDEAAREISAISERKLVVGGRPMTLKDCADDLEIEEWTADLFGSVYCNDRLEDKADALIERIMEKYDAMDVLCEEAK